MSDSQPLRVFVSAGTDHHRFDRLMGWVERWARANPNQTVVVQHGASKAPAGCMHHDLLSAEEMAEEISAADVVVVSAGPGAVMAARSGGRKPIAAPRRKGEAVDDHQLAFASLMDQRQLAFEATDFRMLAALLDRAAIDPGAFACEPQAEEPPEAARTFGNLVDQLVAEGHSS
ncbi:MAG: hypothetical protein ACR2OH_02920 [Microthrixaceae bacterium]